MCLHVYSEKQTFAATRPSAVLLEQLAVCVTKGEPILLVGETGTGKTSTVQYLAGLTGETHNTARKLLSDNMVQWEPTNHHFCSPHVLAPSPLSSLSRTQVTGGEYEPAERHS